jgi:hypothetical protein
METLLATGCGESVPSDCSCILHSSVNSDHAPPCLNVRDPEMFCVEGKEVWDRVSTELPNRSEIMGWIDNQVSAYDNLQRQLLCNSIIDILGMFILCAIQCY